MKQSRITGRTFARLINVNCHKFHYFWAAGIIKETMKLWQTESNYTMLCPVARIMVDRYMEG